MDMFYKLPMHMPNPTMPRPSMPGFLANQQAIRYINPRIEKGIIENPTVSIFDQDPPEGISKETWGRMLVGMWQEQEAEWQRQHPTEHRYVPEGQRTVALPKNPPLQALNIVWEPYRNGVIEKQSRQQNLPKFIQQGVFPPAPVLRPMGTPGFEQAEPTLREITAPTVNKIIAEREDGMLTAGIERMKIIRHNVPWATEPLGPWFIEQVLNKVNKIARQNDMANDYGQLMIFAQAIATAMRHKDRAKAQAILEDALLSSDPGAYATLAAIGALLGVYPSVAGV